MSALPSNEIESELSYAYLHAVASSVGASVSQVSRHQDNAGVDALLTAWGPFPDGGPFTEVDLKIQLKATVRQPRDNGAGLSYDLKGISRYDALRAKEAYATPRILVVLFLPELQDEWLTSTRDSLTLRRCAYWMSVVGAPESENDTSVRLYLPKEQPFDPQNLREIFRKLSRRESLSHQENAS